MAEVLKFYPKQPRQFWVEWETPERPHLFIGNFATEDDAFNYPFRQTRGPIGNVMVYEVPA
jgi:hypothetical protein